LRIVRGEPTPEELAALTAIVTAAAGAAPAPAAAEAPQRRGRWNDPAYTHRRLWPTGPGGWRAALH
jgi:hypothetical protein